MSLTIRLALPTDALDMAEIHMRSWEIAYKDIIPREFICEKNTTRQALYKRVITYENTNAYVIQYNKNTMGIMKIAPCQDNDLNEDFYELHYVYLHPNYFRMGIGTKSLEFAFDIARKLNKKYMTVWVLADNINSIKFYEKCGFTKDDKSKSVEYGKVLSCIRMVKDLHR